MTFRKGRGTFFMKVRCPLRTQEQQLRDVADLYEVRLRLIVDRVDRIKKELLVIGELMASVDRVDQVDFTTMETDSRNRWTYWYMHDRVLSLVPGAVGFGIEVAFIARRGLLQMVALYLEKLLFQAMLEQRYLARASRLAKERLVAFENKKQAPAAEAQPISSPPPEPQA